MIVCLQLMILRFFKGKVAYAMSKVGMTVLALGLAEEVKEYGIKINTIWCVYFLLQNNKIINVCC